MDDSTRKSKSICVPFDDETRTKLTELANKRQQSVASLIRGAVIQMLDGLNSATNVVTNIVNTPSISMAPEAKVPAVITAGYEALTDNKKVAAIRSKEFGPPKACLVCHKEKNEMDEPAISIIDANSSGWGAWACYECFSSGRWYPDKPAIVLKDAIKDQREEGTPPSPVKE